MMSELVLDHFVHSWRGPAVPSVKRTLSVHRLLFTSVLYYYLVHRLIIISRSVRKPSARLRAVPLARCGVGTRGVSRVWVTLYETHRTAHKPHNSAAKCVWTRG